MAGPPRVSIEGLSEHWQVALSRAEAALGAAATCGKSVRFDAADLREFSARLSRERVIVSKLLALIARDERVELHAAPQAPAALATDVPAPDRSPSPPAHSTLTTSPAPTGAPPPKPRPEAATSFDRAWVPVGPGTSW